MISKSLPFNFRLLTGVARIISILAKTLPSTFTQSIAILPMLNSIFFLTSAWLTIHASITSAQTPPCIGDLLDLFDIQTARGTNVAAPVTYILCPNTVYDPSVIPFFLNGNANYLCGGDGSSSNNCILRGGFNQIVISTFDFDFAVKDKILVSGFTFEQSEFVNVVGASPGRLKFHDCIFQVRTAKRILTFQLLLLSITQRFVRMQTEQCKCWRSRITFL